MGRGPRPSDLATLQAVLGGRPAPVDARLRRSSRSTGLHRGSGAARAARLRPPPAVPPRSPDAHETLELGVVPVVNENDATSDDEIRFGDNDRLAALVAHLVSADMLVLLTDTPGLLSADPRLDAEASLIEEVVEIDHELERVAGGPGEPIGSGGMASKLAAAKMATWSGVRCRDRRRFETGRRPGCGGGQTRVSGRCSGRCRASSPARKLWIAFAVGAAGTLHGRRGGARTRSSNARRHCSRPESLGVRGRFYADDAVEIAGPDGQGFRQGPRPPRLASGRLVGRPARRASSRRVSLRSSCTATTSS